MSTKDINILFQGDSITDAGRPYELADKSYCESLGNGYVKILAGQIALEFPEQKWHIHNRGISGNKISQLYARWQADTINLRPSVLSILVGVNDVWHGLVDDPLKFNGTNSKHFDRTYRALLDFTLEELPSVKLMLCEPFLLKGELWTEKFQQAVVDKQSIVKKIAEEYNATFVPLQAAFNKELENFSAEELLLDSVHPTNIGSKVLANAWMEAFRGNYDEYQ